MHEEAAVEIVHWFGTICLVASLLVRILPRPDEIPSRVYSVMYNVVRRCSLNIRGNSNGGPAK